MILPARNGPDLDDVPEAVREAMTFHLAEDIGQVLGWALEDAPRAPGRGRVAPRSRTGVPQFHPPELRNAGSARRARIGPCAGGRSSARCRRSSRSSARPGSATSSTPPCAEEAFPQSVVPGLVLHKGERVISSFSWAFFDDGTGHNARLETAADRPAWRDAYAVRPARPPAGPLRRRTGLVRRPPPARPLAVAGLYRLGALPRRRPTGRAPARPAGPRCSPGRPTTSWRPFHERMPVILPPDLIGPWLAGEPVPLARLLTESPVPRQPSRCHAAGPPPTEQPRSCNRRSAPAPAGPAVGRATAGGGPAAVQPGVGRADRAPVVLPSDGQAATPQLKPAGRGDLGHPGHDPLGLGGGRPRQQDGELVAAEPVGRVLPAGGAPQGAAQRPEPGVAGVVAERVVDRLQAVEVEHHQAEAAAVAGDPPQLPG